MKEFTVYHFDMTKYACIFDSWHAIQDSGGKIVPCDPPSLTEYKVVAIVQAENLEEVFHLTNHIERDWTTNPGVNAVPGQRSTSVGDLVSDKNGVFYYCGAIGWQRVEEPQEA